MMTFTKMNWTAKRRLLSAFAVALSVAVYANCDRPVAAQSAMSAVVPSAADAVTYEQVRPVFKKHCQACHNDDRERGGLDLSSINGIKTGGASGNVAIPGKPDESLLYTLAAQIETPRMPPNKAKIPQRELDLIRHWIEGGMLDRVDPVIKQPSSSMTPKVAGTPVGAAILPVTGSPASEFKACVAVEPLLRATAITALAVSPTELLVAVSGLRQVVLFQPADYGPPTDNNSKDPKVGKLPHKGLDHENVKHVLRDNGAASPGKPLVAAFKAFPFPEGDVFALRFSRDGELLLAGGGIGGLSGKVVGFEVATGRRLFELGDETDIVLALDISADKSLVALGGPSRSVKLFRVADGALIATLRKHTDWILSIAFSPEGLLLASGDRFGGLQVWEAQSGNEFQTLRGHSGPVTSVDWTSDSEQLLSAGQDGSVRFWNMHSGEPVANWNGGVGGILAAQCDSSGRVVCGGREGKIAVWETAGGPSRQMSMTDEIVKLGLSHDASRVFAGDATGNIAWFSLANGERISQLGLPVSSGLVKRERPQLNPTKLLPKPNLNTSVVMEIAAADDEALRTAAELVAVRELSVKSNVALKTSEESLKALRESAELLVKIVADRELIAQNAASRAAELRANAEARQVSGAPVDPAADRDRLVERRQLLETTSALAERLERAARNSPGNGRLQSAAKIAAELRDVLDQDVEAATAQLRSGQKSSRTTSE